METSKEAQLELKLANLIWPDYHKSWNDAGYWYMNDRRIEGPNFKGYVPKWTGDDAACFELMSKHRVVPDVEKNYEHEIIVDKFDHENPIDFMRRMDRLSVVERVIEKLEKQNG